MVVLHVTVQVKPEYVSQFLELVRYDAEHSEKDEPGCLRFDVIEDRDDPNRVYYY
jgi:autoinducer 2-degrading protein